MKQNTFIILFIGTHIFFITAQIYKQSKFVKLSYDKQKHESEKEKLLKKKQELTNTLYALENPIKIKEFATTTLHMEPLSINQVKRIIPS